MSTTDACLLLLSTSLVPLFCAQLVGGERSNEFGNPIEVMAGGLFVRRILLRCLGRRLTGNPLSFLVQIPTSAAPCTFCAREWTACCSSAIVGLLTL